MKISRTVFRLRSGHDFFGKTTTYNVQMTITPKVGKPQLWFLSRKVYTLRGGHDFRTDRRTDRHTHRQTYVNGQNYVSRPWMGLGRHNYVHVYEEKISTVILHSISEQNPNVCILNFVSWEKYILERKLATHQVLWTTTKALCIHKCLLAISGVCWLGKRNQLSTKPVQSKH